MYRGDKVGTLTLTPVKGLVVVAERERVAGGGQRVEGNPPAVRGEDRVGGVGGVQIPSEEPLDGAVPLGRCLLGQDTFACVDTQQIVQGVAAGQVLGEQMGAGQFGEQAAGLTEREPDEGGRSGCGDVGPEMQAQQVEQARGRGGQRVVEPGEDGPHVGGDFAAGEGVEAAVAVA